MIRELQVESNMAGTRGVCLIKFTPHLDLLYVLYGGRIRGPQFLSVCCVVFESPSVLCVRECAPAARDIHFKSS